MLVETDTIRNTHARATITVHAITITSHALTVIKILAFAIVAVL